MVSDDTFYLDRTEIVVVNNFREFLKSNAPLLAFGSAMLTGLGYFVVSEVCMNIYYRVLALIVYTGQVCCSLGSRPIVGSNQKLLESYANNNFNSSIFNCDA